MRAVVVVESMYGNTRAVGDAIAEGLRPGGTVEVVDVATGVEDLPGRIDLLVVGGPTHAHGLSHEVTRRMAAEDHDEVLVGPGLRDWFTTLEPGLDRPAAAFDTRFKRAEVLTGSAAHGIARRLRHHGWQVVREPASFFVADTDGPLLPGELERARAFGAELVAGDDLPPVA